MERYGGSKQVETEVRWDTTASRTYTCSVIHVAADSHDVLLNFGSAAGRGCSGDELSAKLEQRIQLRPMTAKNLRNMLRNLIAEADAAAGGVRP